MISGNYKRKAAWLVLGSRRNGMWGAHDLSGCMRRLDGAKNMTLRCWRQHGAQVLFVTGWESSDCRLGIDYFVCEP